MPLTAPDYARHFTPGHTFSYEDGPVGTLSVVDAGELRLPSGSVVACDPFICLGTGDIPPFTARVAPGSYRVQAAVVTITRPEEPPARDPHLRIAAVRLVIADRPAVTWEPALHEGQDPATLDEDEFFGYGVDAGTGCFYDAAADDSFPDCEGDEGPLWDAFEATGHQPGPYLVDGEDGHNLVAFGSGWGDGAYPTWVGRDAEGEITCFVTDFFVVPPSEDLPA
ncbi:DUF4241 domain-containing protein [Streptomyces goshikiensis]|uniref:DUF4241 domain-containing protein n=1 Tax=Streptomyces goshikiensis TaxID=1942 RepID=A0ABZ1RID9_9ACTN|nr:MULTISPECIES: DUF4241 domain-containing protein [Streptomyces]MBP0936519.1 DUF4241 domain-containing protein [Streptomyces sp. KCTC 0041BP]OKI29679.1 hypothetical protein A6A28_10495 [Streptomyces sp. CB03578]